MNAASAVRNRDAIVEYTWLQALKGLKYRESASRGQRTARGWALGQFPASALFARVAHSFLEHRFWTAIDLSGNPTNQELSEMPRLLPTRDPNHLPPSEQQVHLCPRPEPEERSIGENTVAIVAVMADSSLFAVAFSGARSDAELRMRSSKRGRCRWIAAEVLKLLIRNRSFKF